MNKILLWIVFILLVCVGVTLRFSTSHEEMPIGCDEFGYLNLAKAIDEGVTFSEHAPRPYLQDLLDTLRKEGITENEIAWMVAPHAYHLLPGTNKIINQYPPGTSALLHFVPLHFRKVFFPAFVMLLLVFLPLLAAHKIKSNEFNWFHPVFAGFIFIVTVSAPFLTELTRVNSLALTFGLLIAAGMLLKKYPLWSCLFIALTVNFRVANLLMVLPVFLFTQPTLKQLLSVKNMVTFAGVVVFAVLPLMIFNYFIVGNPFSSTYSSIDQSFSDFNSAINSIQYYFSFDQYWFRVHLVALAVIIGIVLFNKSSLSVILKLLLFPFVNYFFFFSHAVNMDYYPYASAMILVGIAFGMLTEMKISGKFYRMVPGVVLILAVIIVISGISRYRKRTHITYGVAENQYTALCDFDVVWADLYSGTAEYVCKNNGFRFGTTTPRARKIAMQYFYQHQISQAILLDDNTVVKTEILNEVKDAGLNWIISNNEKVGSILIIK